MCTHGEHPKRRRCYSRNSFSAPPIWSAKFHTMCYQKLWSVVYSMVSRALFRKAFSDSFFWPKREAQGLYWQFLRVCVCFSYIWVWETSRYSFESLRCADFESMLESHSNSPHLAQIKFSDFLIFTILSINHPKSARSLFGHHSLVVWGALIIWTRSDHGLHFWTGVTRQHTHSDGSSALT